MGGLKEPVDYQAQISRKEGVRREGIEPPARLSNEAIIII